MTVVIDAADLDAIGADGIPDDGPILVYDADAWYRLRREARRFDVVAAADVLRHPASVEETSVVVMSAWTRYGAVTWEGWPLMDMAAYRHVRWTRRLASVAVPLIDAIRAWRPHRVRVLHRPSGHALDGPATERRRPILAGIAADVARRHGLEVVQPDRPDDPPLLAAAAEPLGDDAGTFAGIEFPVGHVLFVGDGPERPRHAVLGRQITETLGRSVCHVVRGTVPADAIGTAVNESMYAGPRPSLMVPAAATARTRLLAAAAAATSRDPVGLLAGPGIRPHIEFLFGDYCSAIAGNIQRWSRTLERHRPAAVVAGYPEIALEVAARSGRPSVLLPHGPMMLGKDRYHRCQPATVRIAAVGPRHRRMLIGDGIDPRRIRVTGVPGTDADLGAIERPDPEGRRMRLLVPTSESWRPSQSGSRPVTSFAREHATLTRLAAAAWARGWTIELRPHPRYDRELAFYRDALGSAIDDGTAEIRTAAGRTLRDALAESDVVVIPGAPSSTACEAARAGRPVLLLTEAAILPFRRRWGLDGFTACRTVSSLVAALRRLDEHADAWHAAAEATRRAGERLLAPGGTQCARDLVGDVAATADVLASLDDAHATIHTGAMSG